MSPARVTCPAGAGLERFVVTSYRHDSGGRAPIDARSRAGQAINAVPHLASRANHRFG
jgi:hypothetical protein